MFIYIRNFYVILGMELYVFYTDLQKANKAFP